MAWLFPRDRSSVPMDRLLSRPGLFPPLAELVMTLFLSCLGRLLFNRSDGREPLLLEPVVTQEVCWSRMLEEF